MKTLVKKALISVKYELLQNALTSRLYETPCFPAGAGPDFINAVISGETSLSAQDLLAGLHGIEAEFGRERTERWGARTLDLDLIDYDGQVLPNRSKYDEWRTLSPERQAQIAPEELILPHPRVQDRAFVLQPMLDVAPNWVHPVSGEDVKHMLNALSPTDREAVRPLPQETES